jgi:molybdopterin synthase catalytic subunit
MAIIITHTSFDPFQAIASYQQTISGPAKKPGATAVFIGTMRDFNQGDSVRSMRLEYYPGMTEKQLDKIVAEAKQQWQIIDCHIVHRVGDIQPDDAIVVIAIWASHRGDAFDACRYVMEALKTSAPFWKKELLTTGESRWVQHNTDGYSPATTK